MGQALQCVQTQQSVYFPWGFHSANVEVVILYVTLTSIPQRIDTWLLCAWALHAHSTVGRLSSINRVTNVNTNGQGRRERMWCDVTISLTDPDEGEKQDKVTAVFQPNILGHSLITFSLHSILSSFTHWFSLSLASFCFTSFILFLMSVCSDIILGFILGFVELSPSVAATTHLCTTCKVYIDYSDRLTWNSPPQKWVNKRKWACI